MIIVNPDLISNIVEFLPRYYAQSSNNIEVYITNEDTRKDLVHDITDVLKNDGSIFFTTNADFKNNVTYSLKVVDINLSIVIYRAKVFSTTQSKQNYSING